MQSAVQIHKYIDDLQGNVFVIMAQVILGRFIVQKNIVH